MRGLLEKDIRLILQQKQTVFIYLAISVFMSITLFDSGFVIVYMTVLGISLALGTMNVDEADNGFLFLMTMPINARIYVKEKFCFCTVLTVITAALALMVQMVSSFATGREVGLLDGLMQLGISLLIALVLLSVMLPIQLKFGSAKKSIVMLFVFGIVALISVYSKKIAEGTGMDLSKIAGVLGRIKPWQGCVAGILLVAIVVLVSYFGSVRIMQKKEY